MMSNESNSFQPLNNFSLREQTERRVRDAILSGSFSSGERIVESAIAEQLGISRAPVREALSALEREGLIIQIPRRGYFVVEFTSKDIEEIYSLRLILEIGALPRVIEHLTDDDIAELQQVIGAFGKAVREGRDHSEIVDLDLSFHDLICQKAKHGRLHSVWHSMRLQTWLLIGLTSKTEYDYPDQPVEFHQRILDAIVDKDLHEAESLLREHILDAQQRALAAYKVTNRPFDL